MNAFHFGQRLRIKLAAGPGLPAPTASLTGKPSLPSTPSPQLTISGSGLPKPPAAPKPPVPSSFKGGPVGVGGEPTWGNFAYEFGQNFNPWNGRKSQTGYGSYGDVLDRWFNPNTKQQVTEKGEHGLMRGAQIAAGTGAAAGVLAGGIAAAPAVGSALGMGGTGGTASGAAGGSLAAASQTPVGQRLMQGAQSIAHNVQLGANNVMNLSNRFNYSPDAMLEDGAAIATGNFDQLKGPGWSVNTPSFPAGAPSRPTPLQTARQLYGVANETAARLMRGSL